MKKLTIVLVGLLLNSLALAAPSSYVELGYMSGGENGENGAGEENGFEVAGSFAFSKTWYAGGTIGNYERDRLNIENDYFNINGGAVIGLTERTDLITELAFWGGQQKSSGIKNDPTALEFKFGVNSSITDRFAIFGSISLIAGDLDAPTNSDLTNFVWSAGGAYNFTPHLSASLKVVEGSNGVNGQSDIFRIGGRWTF